MRPIIVVGAGNMAQQYARVLLHQGHEFVTIGRGEKSSIKFEQVIGKEVYRGGLETYLNQNHPDSNLAIVTVSVKELFPCTSQLLNHGIKRILVEKPGANNSDELRELASMAEKAGATVFLGYNRRFYQSVQELRDRINEENGARSMSFEFTERSHILETLNKPQNELSNWLLSNSSHVLDTAFFLCGLPKMMSATSVGRDELAWHPVASRFCGSGITEKDIPFSYWADWTAPGSWSIEINTASSRYILRPMEELKILTRDSSEVRTVNLEHKSTDNEFKPGLYAQTEAFIQGRDEQFVTIDDQINMAQICKRVLEGDEPCSTDV